MVAKSILHHFETMGNHGLLVFTGESSFHGLLGGAGFRPSTVVNRQDGMCIAQGKFAIQVDQSSDHGGGAAVRAVT